MRNSSSMFAALLLTGASLCAAPVSFIAQLGNFEAPPTGSLGTGWAFVTMDVVANTLAINASFSGLTGLTTAAHIHCCIASPGNISVATQTPSFIGFPLGVSSGSFSNVYDTSLASTYRAGFITANGGTPDSAEAALFAGLRAGQAYFNIHSDTSPSGEIRGFLVETPEPASLSLVGVALLGLAFVRRRAASRD